MVLESSTAITHLRISSSKDWPSSMVFCKRGAPTSTMIVGNKYLNTIFNLV